MSLKNLQFAVGTHVAAMLADLYGESATSTQIAASVNAEPTFVRRTIAKLAKAGLVTTTRGKSGSCTLARAPDRITLLDIYRAAQAPPAASRHAYPVQQACPISRAIQPCMAAMLGEAQAAFETALSQRTLADLLHAMREQQGFSTGTRMQPDRVAAAASET